VNDRTYTTTNSQTNAIVSLVHFLQNIRPSVTLELERGTAIELPQHRRQNQKLPTDGEEAIHHLAKSGVSE
tara:strand:+ start:28662 stop:28874 length:213 start_codon:yes stop_codon:yes gene_type:complete